jgi:tetratricopeptide (TPR) repeat protein
MFKSLVSRIATLSAAAITFSSAAYALSCDEIMNMVNVNVPVHIVVQTMEDSGSQFTAADIRCLQRQNAPSEVLDTARSNSGSAEEPEPEQREERRDSREDDRRDREMLGESRRDRRSDAYDELPEDGDDGAPVTECDREIENARDRLRARKPLAASKILFDVLEGGQCPDQTTKAHYYLARTLYEMEMYHSAQHYFMQVVRRGPANRYFKHALPKLVAIARFTGDNSELMRIVHRIPPDEYPRQAKNHLYYLMGVRLYEREELSDARRYFGQISTRSELYLRSKYFEGVIFNQQGRLRSAVQAFRDVIRDADGVELENERAVQEVSDLTDLSLLNVARVYYGIQRFDEASRYYSMVPRDSTYWPEALFEEAWSTFMQNDLNHTLGLLLTVNSPFYSEGEFLPEADVLRALTFFNLCEYDDVSEQLLGFEGEMAPIADELREFVERYRGQGRRELHDQAYDEYFGERTQASVLPESLFVRFLRNKDLASLVRHIDIMAAEEELIEDQKALWRDTVGAHLRTVIAEDRQAYKLRAGRLLLREADAIQSQVTDLLGQSEIIRFEVVSAQRADYTYRMTNPEMNDGFQGLELDFATSVDFIYWPFNGEFWQDELGYYRYTEQGSCN